MEPPGPFNKNNVVDIIRIIERIVSPCFELVMNPNLRFDDSDIDHVCLQSEQQLYFKYCPTSYSDALTANEINNCVGKINALNLGQTEFISLRGFNYYLHVNLRSPVKNA